ncbi:hypothetical protein BCR33DRAFT_715031 [Rhizoclosmatium globosum]|uniref:SH3 domain-containing protein n=1 Tax=Rhizoclosmatium globosum TaxID=329046 RepID=A0A1Y2CJW8_9FUNG|nr:hypothetical protein BCR33DRAFT_715031 [Rhizoclosmatium globosum]|eukprot:ORY47286.1 hypothetical protein BCR33DRAFT_715031 [Rhizoclosmatium globosum]
MNPANSIGLPSIADPINERILLDMLLADLQMAVNESTPTTTQEQLAPSTMPPATTSNSESAVAATDSKPSLKLTRDLAAMGKKQKENKPRPYNHYSTYHPPSTQSASSLNTASSLQRTSSRYSPPPSRNRSIPKSVQPSILSESTTASTTPSQTSTHTPKRCMIIMGYNKTEHDEITVRVGQEVEITHTYDDGWVLGSIVGTSNHGVFPGTCVSQTPKVRKPSAQPQQAEQNHMLTQLIGKRMRVIGVYMPLLPDELGVEVGDLIEVIECFEDSWARGRVVETARSGSGRVGGLLTSGKERWNFGFFGRKTKEVVDTRVGATGLFPLACLGVELRTQN